MTDIRTVADGTTKERYYPQTHWKAIVEFDDHVKEVFAIKYLKDLKSINVSGLFYCDENTKNLPKQLSQGCFIQSIFFDKNTGIVKIEGTANYYQINDGNWTSLKTVTDLNKIPEGDKKYAN